MKYQGKPSIVNVPSLAMTCNAVCWVAISEALSKRKLWSPNLISFRDNEEVYTDSTETKTQSYRASAKHFTLSHDIVVNIVLAIRMESGHVICQGSTCRPWLFVVQHQCK